MSEDRLFRGRLVLSVCSLTVTLAACSGGSAGTSSSAAPATQARASASPTVSADITDTQRAMLSGHPVDPAPAGATGPDAKKLQNNSDMAQFVMAVLDKEDRMWTTFMRAAGLKEQQIRVNEITADDHLPSTCVKREVKDSDKTFFCATDSEPSHEPPIYGTGWLPLTGLLDSSPDLRLTTSSTFRLATVIADTWNSGMVAEIARQLAVKPPSGRGAVLMPQCLTGVWESHTYGRKRVSAADEKAAVTAMSAQHIFDFGPATAEVPAADRLQALRLGAHGSGGSGGGDPGACVKAYWSTT